ncbi:hypothetical protein BH93_24120 [Rhodococcoides fascians A25f]|uniref:hypothetical protein n=1 Tax=Rhodococcoides fascians TaxID=1828 RepID=UPI0005604482|nr:hypothetical protein [Rhodococcus fascians]QII08059.1 hypothetical protein BH93_24120 [Rhodococcus fascians A25f]
MPYEYSTTDEALRSERPTVLAESPDLNRTEKAVAWLSNIRVYSFGLMFSVSVLTPELDVDLVLGEPDFAHHPGTRTSVLFGVEFADGRTVALDRPAPDRVLMEVRDSYSGAGSLQASVLLVPIPPPGPLRFVTAIPGLDVSEAVVTLDGDHIVAVSEKVERLWTGRRNPNGLGGAGLRGGGWFNRLD